MTFQDQGTELYQLRAIPHLSSSVVFKNHLPYEQVVRGQVVLGSPEYRAVETARQSKSAGLSAAFAANAHAFLRGQRRLEALSPEDRVTRQEIETQLTGYLAGMNALALALIAQDPYPISISEYVKRATTALFLAVTGLPCPDHVPLPMACEPPGLQP